MPNPESKYRTSTKLRNAIRKYGWDDFSTEVLATTDNKDQANKLEAEFIKKFGSVESGYNLQSGGINFYHSSETKKRIGEGNKGKVRSEEFKKKLSEHRKKVMTTEYRAMLSEKCSGWSHTDEAKKRIGDNSRGKHYTLGRKQSDEEKQMRSIVARNVAPMACGHKRHNRYSKCITMKK